MSFQTLRNLVVDCAPTFRGGLLNVHLYVSATISETPYPQPNFLVNNAGYTMSQNTKELKTLLHERIENIDDEELLHSVKILLDQKYQSVSEPQLTEYQVKRIEKAKLSISKGETLTNEQADELVDRWLNE